MTGSSSYGSHSDHKQVGYDQPDRWLTNYTGAKSPQSVSIATATPAAGIATTIVSGLTTPLAPRKQASEPRHEGLARCYVRVDSGRQRHPTTNCIRIGIVKFCGAISNLSFSRWAFDIT